MDAIPVMPVSPAPAPDAAAAPRDGKGCEADQGFGDALKQGIASRSSDANDSPADGKPAAEAPTEDKLEDTASSETAPAIDPAVAALFADATLPPALPIGLPVTLAVTQPPVATEGSAAADAAVGEVTAAETRPAAALRAVPDAAAAAAAQSGERGVKTGSERALAERAGIERSVGERATLERAASGAFERAAAERLPADRGVGEPRDVRTLPDREERTLGARDKTSADAVASLMSGFTVDRSSTAADAPLPLGASASTLDTLSAATLGAKWGAPAAAGPDAAAAPATARVDTPLGSADWGDAFQNKVVWMVDRHLERAELHINPPHLGPVDVMLNLTGDGAQIAFASPHAAVRDAIEASLPDLRDALDQRGVSLGQATVGADSGAAREQFAEHAREAAKNSQNGRSGGALVVEAPTPARAAVVRRGLVDTFA